jgi:hypothetical protein
MPGVLLHGGISQGYIGWADPTQPNVGEVLVPITPGVKTLKGQQVGELFSLLSWPPKTRQLVKVEPCP